MRLTYVPLAGDWQRGAVLDADGQLHRVDAGTLTIVETWLCITAEVLDEVAGMMWVQFPDGSKCWVMPHPTAKYDPDPTLHLMAV